MRTPEEKIIHAMARMTEGQITNVIATMVVYLDKLQSIAEIEEALSNHRAYLDSPGP